MSGGQDNVAALAQRVQDFQRAKNTPEVFNMSRDWRVLTKGISLDYCGIKFAATGRKTHDWGDGMVSKNGVVKFADGTMVHAVLDLCPEDSGEHYGTLFFVPHDGGQVVPQKDLLRVTGKPKSEVFPYRYKYTGRLDRDHHVGPDGWSR